MPRPSPRKRHRRRAARPSGTRVSGHLAKPRERSSLLTLLARANSPVDLLPILHRHALTATGGTRSLLFERNARTGTLRATSAYGLDGIPLDPWIPSKAESELVTQIFS